MMAGGKDEAKEAENNTAGPKFTGTGLPGGKDDDKKKKKKGLLGGKGPLVMIMTLLLGGGGLMGVTQSLAPFGVVARGIAEFNTNSTVMRGRSTYFTRFMMDNTRNKPLTKYGVFSGEKFKISSSLQKKLARHNIDYQEIENSAGKKIRMLIFTDEDGTVSPIVTRQQDLDGLPDFYKSRAMLLDDALSTNDGFFVAQERATRTIKGRIAGWFDDLSESFHRRIQNSRNRFGDVSKKATSEEIQASAKRTGMSGESNDSEGNYKEETTRNPETDEETTTRERVTDNDTVRRGMSASELETTLRNRVSKVAAGANFSCAVLRSIGAINLAIAGINVAQIINYATGFLEAVQKTQAGEGGSELSYYMNGLTQAGETKDLNGDVVSENKSSMASPAIASLFGGASVSADDTMAMKYNVENMSILGTKSAFQQGLIGAVGGFATGIAAFKMCSIAQAGAGVVGLAADIILIVSTAGIGNIIKALFQGIAEAALKAAAVTAVFSAISLLIPTLAQMLATDVISNMAGQDAGYMISSAFNIYQGRQHRATGGTGGDADAVNRMNLENSLAVAAEARYERLERSPFDVTSEHTFLGSIVHSLTPTITSASYAPSMITSISGLLGSSLTKLIPVAGAAAENLEYVSGFNTDCPNLQAFDLIGDAYCNPYHTTDYSTIEADPGEVFDIVNKRGATYDEYSTNYNEGNELCYVRTDADGVRWYGYHTSSNFETLRENKNDFDDNGNNTAAECYFDNKLDNDGNAIIKADGSELSTFIIACTLRDSQYGIVDANVQSWLTAPTGNSGLNAAINTGVGVIPLIGDAADIVQAAAEAANLKWNSGEACVDSSANPYWNDYTYFQRYLEDQRLLEAYGVVEQSAQVAVVEKFYEENPLDDSYEGVIARYSGLSKDEVIAVLDLAEYASFLAEYDPSGLYPLPHEAEEKVLLSEIMPANVVIAGHADAPVPQVVIYADVRNRSYAV
jgi:hypothetical protein